jgi:hypothetical protein
LQYADVDLGVGTLHVRRSVHRFGGDAAARRPLLGDRKRLQAALKTKARTPDAADMRVRWPSVSITTRGLTRAI